MSHQLTRLLQIMARLRDPVNGCEWDVAQTFETIAPYTIEEAYEVVDAIERSHMDDLRDELGDLLLQVVFNSRIAEEAGYFTFQDVAQAISDKMEARHPHIFAANDDDAPGAQKWEDLKQQEREAKGERSAMDGVASALPALLRAEKLQKRAARAGFDWPDVDGPAAKVAEEAAELAEAADGPDKLEEAGDFIFSAVNLVRAYGIAPEQALRAANSKFERRFRAMEDMADGRFDTLTLEQQENLWQEVKRQEKSEQPSS
ncbi:nucleoside triphosphate pyrophosphohydrolase [Altericroceibacterium endophyticum]|uniref:Nucleoside triphosphate pyrophosphohydrolase n=1 Tax=Altericroceibacterium endophyticum TaxID=1808508 RepID=A0A6I4T335_9SPHN|nr:nucleoside triphosphate pyrophosphohydrolase [Altericroceibacterium endophyticum]MXO64523.1 nucleoside triphosphate pyrophosphohydrolase [Altericroceibacterium endophyticum]